MNFRIYFVLPSLLGLGLTLVPAAAQTPILGAQSRLTGVALPAGAVQLQNPAAIARMKAGFGSAVGKPVGDLEFYAWSGGKAALRDQISARLKAAGFKLTPLPNLTAPGIQAYSVTRRGQALYEVWSRDTNLADVTFFRVGPGSGAASSALSASPAGTSPPGSGSAPWASQGYAALNAKKYQAATNDYMKALAAEPHNAEYLYNLGVSVDGLKHYASAAAAYRTAISLKPDIQDARTNLGIDLIHMKKYPEAIKVLRDATERQPDDALAFRSLGDAFYDSGQNNLAAFAYRTATQLAPSDATAFQYLGDALGNLGKSAPALAAYAEAVRLNPSRRLIIDKNEAELRKKPQKPTVADVAVTPDSVSPIPTETAAADVGPPPPGDYRCTWTHRDPGQKLTQSEYMGRFTLKADGTYSWMDSTEPGTYAFDPATQAITFTGGRLGRDGIQARFHHTRAGQPLIFVSFNTDYTRAKGKGSVLWVCVPADAGAGM